MSPPRCSVDRCLLLKLVLIYAIAFTDAQFRSSQRTHLTYSLADDTPNGTLVGHVGLDSGLYSAPEINVTAIIAQPEVALLFIFRPGRLPSPLVTEDDVCRLFYIDPSTGSLTTSSSIDRDVICAEWHTCLVELNVQVQKTVSGRSSPNSFTFVKVFIAVDDVNDNAPTFIDVKGRPETSPSSHVIVVSEGSAVGTRVSMLPAARDIDSPVNGVRRYAVSSVSLNISEPEVDDSRKPEDVFGVEMDANMDVYLVLRQAIDRETIDSYNFELVAYDFGDPPLSGTTSVRVEVADVNDNLPAFDRVFYETSVPEDVDVGTVILRVHAGDPDQGINGRVIYSIKRRNRKNIPSTVTGIDDDLPPFVIDPTSGAIRTSGLLDFESASSYVLTVIAGNSATDSSTGNAGSPGLTSMISVAHAQIIINVTDVNDVNPVVTFRTAFDGTLTEVAHLTEALPVGTFVAHVTAMDPDPIGGSLDCRLNDEESFHLEELFRGEYQLVATVTFDRELSDRYDVTVTCHDSSTTISLTGSAQLVVHIDDVNDNRPTYPVTEYRVVGTVGENQPSETSVVRLHAIDLDIGLNSAVEYRLVSSPNVDQNDDFRLNTKTGQLTTARGFDREKEPVIRVTVAAIDGGEPPLSSIVDVVVFVGDEDDESPQFTENEYIFYVEEELRPLGGDFVVGRVTANDADMPPYNNITYILDQLPATNGATIAYVPYPFRLIGATDGGVLLLDRPLDREQSDLHQFAVRACSSDGRCDVAVVRVHVTDVNDNNPSFLFPSPLLNDTVHVGLDFDLEDAVAVISAVDPDAGDNGHVIYGFVSAAELSNTSSLGSSSAENYFRLDETNGKIFPQCEILHPGTYALPVAAVDGGGRRAVTILYVIVNTTLTFGVEHGSGSRLSAVGSNGHLITVIIIGGTTCPLVALLLAAIGSIVYRHDRHRQVGSPPPQSSHDGIYFRKSSAQPSTATVTSANSVNVEYATLGRSRKLVPGGAISSSNRTVDERRLSLARSNVKMVAGLSDCDSCGRNNDDTRRSHCSLSRDKKIAVADRFSGSDCSSFLVAAVEASDATAVAVPGGMTSIHRVLDMTDSGRGSSEEVSSRRVSINVSVPIITSPQDSPASSKDERCQMDENDACAPRYMESFCATNHNAKAATTNDLSRTRSRLPSTPIPDGEAALWPSTMKPVSYTQSPSVHRKMVLCRSPVHNEHDCCNNRVHLASLKDVRNASASGQRQRLLPPERSIEVVTNSFRPCGTFRASVRPNIGARDNMLTGYKDLPASSPYNSYV